MTKNIENRNLINAILTEANATEAKIENYKPYMVFTNIWRDYPQYQNSNCNWVISVDTAAEALRVVKAVIERGYTCHVNTIYKSWLSAAELQRRAEAEANK